ncbi:MAG: hypothetical protein MJ154_03520 [Candidatus Saccharibacteria bacterium]|nr:hypothetical protein [Candidatus Saccharibacteria bacterium]
MNRDRNTNNFVSANSDNRKFCLFIQRQKFCYETYEKAQKACEYSNNPQRIYYCKSCCAYHTTHYLNKEHVHAGRLLAREKSLRRARSGSDKVLFIKRFSTMTPAMKRVLAKQYNPVVRKYLVEYLYESRDDVALSDAELKSSLLNTLKDKKDDIFNETIKWPFCELGPALVFYALYYIQEIKFYYGHHADDIVEQLFNESDGASFARLKLRELQNFGQIIVVNEDSSGKRFKFDTFIIKTEKEQIPFSPSDEEPLEVDDEPTIAAALNAKYNPIVKNYLVQHLRKNRFNDEMLQGDGLKEVVNEKILLDPTDEKMQQALSETQKWRFKTEKNAWKFLLLYYLEITGGIYASGLRDITNKIFFQGAHTNGFMSSVRSIIYKEYTEGGIIITSMKNGEGKYSLKA